MLNSDDMDYGLLAVESDKSFSSKSFCLTGARYNIKAVGVFLEIEAYYKYKFDTEEVTDAVFRFPWKNGDHAIYWCEITESSTEGCTSSTVGRIIEKFEAQATATKVEHGNHFQMYFKAKASIYQECEFKVLFVASLSHAEGEQNKLEYTLPELAQNSDDIIPVEVDFSIEANKACISLLEEDGCITPGSHKYSEPTTAITIGMKYEDNMPCSLHYSKGRPLGGFLEHDVAVLTLPRSDDEVTGRDLTQGEYIFCVDRSASMGGERIKHAKETLLLFLKSLPVGCSFNIYSFGSRWTALFGSGSQEYNADTLGLASDLQRSMSSDMGGTNLTPALENIYSSAPVEGKFRSIFVLTDGGIWDKDQAINLVKRNADNTTLCAFGVGNGADQTLVKGLAEAGGGQHDFVSTEDRSMETKVISALQWVTMGGNQTAVKSTVPNGMEVDKVIVGNTDDKTEVHYIILKGKAKGRGKKAKQVSFKFMMGGEEHTLEADIPAEAPGEGNHLPLHLAAAREALAQNMVVAGLSRAELCEKVNIFIPEMAVRTEHYVLRADDMQMTENTGVSVPEEIRAPSPPPSAPTASTARPHLAASQPSTALPPPVTVRRGRSSCISDSAFKNIKKVQLKKIARRAGVGRFSGLIFEEARMCLVQFLEKMVKDAILYAENGRRKTVTEEDVDCALKKNGVKMYGVEDYAPYIFEKRDQKTKRTAGPIRRTWKRTTPVGNPNATTSIASVLGVDTTDATPISKGALRKPSLRQSTSSDDQNGENCDGNTTPTTAKRARMTKKPTLILDSENGKESTANSLKRKASNASASGSLSKTRSKPGVSTGEPASKRTCTKQPVKGKGGGKGKLGAVSKGKQVMKKSTRSARKEGGFVKDFTVMIQLISLQNFDGSWDLSLDLANIFKQTKQKLVDHMPDTGSIKTSLNQWATILSLTWLNTYYEEQQMEWEMIGYKAREYLNKVFSINVLASLKAKAKELFP